MSLNNFFYLRSRGLSLWDSLDYSDLLIPVLLLIACLVFGPLLTWWLGWTDSGNAVLAWIWSVK